MHPLKNWAAIAAVLLLSLPLSAQEIAEEEEPEVTVVVTAERGEQPAGESIASVTVITAKEIRETGAQTVADVLKLAPGLDVRQSGTLGSLAVPAIRGVKPSQVLVLVDGQRVSSAAFISGVDLSKFPVEDIERVEVIRGPVSSLYGSDAMGGVINIITNKPTEAGGDAKLGFGGHGRAERSFSAHDAADRFAWQLTGAFPAFDGIRPNSDFSARDLSARVVIPAAFGWEFTVHGEDYHDRTGIIGPVNDPDPDDSQMWDRRNIDLAATRALGHGDLQVRGYRITQRLENPRPNEIDYDAWDFVSFPPPMADFNSVFTGTTNAGEVTFRRAISAHQLLVGGEFRREEYGDVESKNGAVTTTQDEHFTNGALFVQDRWSVTPRADLVLGARYDDHSTAGSVLAPRAGINFAPAANTRVRASYSQGFRAPNFVELFYRSPFFNGNPALEPERSKQYEVGVNLQRNKHEFDLAVFQINVRDQIEVNGAFSSYVNIGRARQRGAEVTWGYRVTPATRLDLTYSFLDAKNPDTGEQLLRLPRHKVTLTAATRVRSWDVALTGRLIDRRQDLIFDPNTYANVPVTIPSSTVFDLTLTQRKERAVNPYLVIRNLTNTSYEEIAGYPTEGRSLEAGLRASW